MRSLAVAVCAGAVGFVGAFAAACTSDNPGAPVDAGEAGLVDVIEAGEAEAGLEQNPDVYPADHQPIPLLTNPSKGPVLASPSVVTITFAGDTRRDSFRMFDDTILTTDWWKASIGGIGVGVGANGGHVELTPPWIGSARFLLNDTDVQPMLQRGISNGTIPPPTPGTVYALYFPKNVTVQALGGASCQSFCGYHSDTTVLVPAPGDGGTPEAGASDGGASDAGTDGGDAGDAGAPEAGPQPTGTPVDVAYAMMPTCDVPTCWSNDAFEQMTITASHELAEAVSDPYPQSNPGFLLETDDSWLNPDLYAPGNPIENGDACSSLNWTEGNYRVQRIWSNAAAMRGDQPCQPVPAGAIYFAAAVRTTAQQINGHKSFGYLRVKLGGSATAIVNVFSLAPLPHDLLLYAGAPKRSQSDPSDLGPLKNDITVELSKQTAHNGNAAILNVNVPDTGTKGDFRLVVRAVLDMDYNDWPLILHVY